MNTPKVLIIAGGLALLGLFFIPKKAQAEIPEDFPIDTDEHAQSREWFSSEIQNSLSLYQLNRTYDDLVAAFYNGDLTTDEYRALYSEYILKYQGLAVN